MKRFFYHGTSADNLESILSNGLSCNENKLWNVSEDNIYLWCPLAVGKACDCKDNEDCENRAFQMAFESAQFACSIAKDCRAIVLKIELDDTEIFDDTSCENMISHGAVCIDRDILINEITEIKVSNDLSILKGYFMNLSLSNDYSNIELSSIEKKVAQVFNKAEIYPEDIDEITEWEILELTTA